MEKEVYFREETDRNACCGQVYSDFIDYAFSKADFLCLCLLTIMAKGIKQSKSIL